MSSVNSTTPIEYRPINGFPRYRVGSDGSVWSTLSGFWKRMKPGWSGKYRAVHLWDNGKRSTRYVHRLVLETLVGPCPEGMMARHYPDRDVSNCALSNLRWDTLVANHADKREHGTLMIGEGHTNSKLTIAAVQEIKAATIRRGMLADLGRRFGVSEATIRDVLKGNTWRHVDPRVVQQQKPSPPRIA